MAAAKKITVGVAAVLAEVDGTVLLWLFLTISTLFGVDSCFSSELQHKPSNHKVNPEVTGMSPGSTILFLRHKMKVGNNYIYTNPLRERRDRCRTLARECQALDERRFSFQSQLDSNAAFIGLLTPRTIGLLKPKHRDFPPNEAFHVQE